jgi:hypothetical protein
MKTLVRILSLILLSQLAFANDSLNVQQAIQIKKSLQEDRGEPAVDIQHSTFDIRHSTLIMPESSRKKSGALAVIYSILVPGMGELYAERFDVGKYSLIAEGALWLVFAGFQFYGTWLQDDARQFAVSHAQADPNGKDDQFWIDVSNFLNTYDFNEKKLRDRDLASVYNVNAGYFWRWESDAARLRFRDMRISADNVFNNSRFVVVAILVNHLISAVNAARLTAGYNKGLNEEQSLNFKAGVIGTWLNPDGVVLTVQQRF